MTKQYKSLFAMDNVELEFTPEALKKIAKKALERKSGARGLRAIIEDVMQDTMFDLPGMDDVAKCIITEDAVDKKTAPTLVKKTDALPAPKKRRTTKKAKAETEEVLPEAEANA